MLLINLKKINCFIVKKCIAISIWNLGYIWIKLGFFTKLWRCVCDLDRARLLKNRATAAANSNRTVNSTNGCWETRSSHKIEKERLSCLAITLSCVPRYRPINKWGNWTCLIISVDLRVILETFSLDSWVCLLASRLTT